MTYSAVRSSDRPATAVPEFYYRGFRQDTDIPEYLNDTCLSAQDHYREVCKKFKVKTSPTSLIQIFPAISFSSD